MIVLLNVEGYFWICCGIWFRHILNSNKITYPPLSGVYIQQLRRPYLNVLIVIEQLRQEQPRYSSQIYLNT